jgi:S-DNA-T family DNA segregation ATPase FtsK/SpoIIIE
MPDLLFDRQRGALGELWRLIEERRHGEKELSFSSTQAEETAIENGERARKDLATNQEGELAALDAAFHKEQEDLTNRQSAEESAAQKALVENRQRLEAKELAERDRIGEELRDALWMAESVLDGGQKRVQEQLEVVRHQVASVENRIAALWQIVDLLLARFDLQREDVTPNGKLAKPAAKTAPDPEGSLSRADLVMRRMQELRILPWTRWPVSSAIGVAVAALSTIPVVFVQPPIIWIVVWLVSGVTAGFLVGWITRVSLHAFARRRLQELGRKFVLLVNQAHDLGKQLLAETEPWATVQHIAFRNQHDAERRKAQSMYRPRLEELKQRFQAERQVLEEQSRTSSEARHERDRQALAISRREYEARRSQCLARQEQERRDNEAAHAEKLRYLQLTHSQKARQLRQRWETEAARLLALFTELQRIEAEWRQGDKGTRSGIAGLSIGTLTVDVPKLAGDLPAKELAPWPPRALHQPAFVPFPRLGGLLLHAFGQGRGVAVQTLQAVMLRLLTALPPGKVRFTIFDPVGLGDNFAAFMHLADHDEALVTSRIWTEPAHIEKQLVDLTVHMENVIQRYLRSQFSSIEDYNAQAGEVAEPYRVLVVANFPVNFTPQAARRLVSIVQSGSSCGVYALIGLDTRQALPQGFRVEDLEALCLNLYWRQERFQWGDIELDRYPLTPEAPPDANQVIETVRRVGALSRDANRVRVPFSFVAPPAEEIWKADSRRGVTVPLGRAGAVSRLALQLGKGTAQHVLVAGKTGSGKSTLWHALIANLALLYRPDEVELYLIDFKKGVEFKPYAVHQLPHAQVIAIESEREFGLSVLQRLDAELRRRGDLFRSAGVNDIAGYRDGHPEAHCPRILLIVDEFQEFFVEDDRLSQEAALLLDRLVRQGRAFGLHVLLGSQTLGGAYSLARSTIDQMAVRIALQCSEADAQLILNKDNSTARLLSRPGEAIYNDANGAIEGNEVFQVVWLPEEEREQIIDQVRQRAVRELPEIASRPALVFEGNTPAELDRNPLLRRVLQPAESAMGHENQDAHSPFGKAWLGEAIAIKDPTAAVFRPQTSDNLLIVGQNDEAALALLASALVSLAVQQPSAHFVVLDGTAPHQPHAGYLKAVMKGWPQPMLLADRAGLSAALAALAEEMNQRLKGDGSDRSVRYLLINGLQAYREFRRGDDDLGFGRRGADRTVSPLEHLQSLLRDGPAVGLHVLIWCDSLVNVMRSLDRAGLRECGQRVLFQMSATDSSHLLDSPLASRLGRNRALYYTDELGQPEKFRPYGLPSLAWLTEIKGQCTTPLASPL